MQTHLHALLLEIICDCFVTGLVIEIICDCFVTGLVICALCTSITLASMLHM